MVPAVFGATPGTPQATDPRPGDVVMFKYRGAWVRGRVISDEHARVALQRLGIVQEGSREAWLRATRRMFWRNRTQIFEVS